MNALAVRPVDAGLYAIHMDGCDSCANAIVDGVLTLCAFGERSRAEILALVDLPTAPPKRRPDGAISRAWYEWHKARGGRFHRADGGRFERPHVSAKLRAAVIARDGALCQLCGQPVDLSRLHLDHRIPWVRGGPTTLENLQVTHPRCNLRKGAR